MSGLNQSKAACACCGDMLRHRFDRRHFLTLAGAAGMAAAMQPLNAFAASGNYEAMVLSCIDPRLQEPVRKYTASRNLTGKYSQFTFAGAAVGVVAPAFKDWQKTFWDNLAATILGRVKTFQSMWFQRGWEGARRFWGVVKPSSLPSVAGRP